MSNLSSLPGFNTVDGGATENPVTSVSKSGGSNQAGYAPVQIAGIPSIFDADTENNVQKAFINGSGDYTHPVDNSSAFSVGTPTHQRKGSEVDLENPFVHTGALHTKIQDREPDVTGLTLSAEGKWLDPDGDVVTLVSGIVVNHEMIDGSGDNSAESRYPPTSNPGSYTYRDPIVTNKSLEARVGS